MKAFPGFMCSSCASCFPRGKGRCRRFKRHDWHKVTMRLTFELAATAEHIASWADGSLVPAVCSKTHFPGSVSRRHLVLRRHGHNGRNSLSWLEHGYTATSRNLLQEEAVGVVASEALDYSLPWNAAFRRRRCLVPATAFHTTRGRSRCALSLASGEVFAMGAVWDRVNDGGEQSLDYFTLITVPPNPLIASVFGEVPLLVAPGDYSQWLDDSSEASAPSHLVKSLSAVELKRWQLGPVPGES